MRKITMVIAAVSAASVAWAGIATADFTADVGKVRPELHSSGFGPRICSQTKATLDEIRSMGFKSARTHDWALANPNQRVCDWHHIFPLPQLDATKPENYVFSPTDYLLKRTREETGLDIFFRLGTSIEHSGPHVHFNALIPTDFDKIAETFAGTVRHYNRGWANGFRWNILHWEIWAEPDGCCNMWCLPEGDWGSGGADRDARDVRRREAFARFYVTCLKRLKGEFGDEIRESPKALILDHTHDLEPLSDGQVAFEDGKLILLKPDFFSAVFFVTFDS